MHGIPCRGYGQAHLPHATTRDPLTTMAISRPTSRTSRWKQSRAASSSSCRLLRTQSAPWKTCCCSLCSTEQVHQLTMARSPLRHSVCLTPVWWKCSNFSRCGWYPILAAQSNAAEPSPGACRCGALVARRSAWSQRLVRRTPRPSAFQRCCLAEALLATPRLASPERLKQQPEHPPFLLSSWGREFPQIPLHR
jgi:hypothetical protein